MDKEGNVAPLEAFSILTVLALPEIFRRKCKPQVQRRAYRDEDLQLQEKKKEKSGLEERKRTSCCRAE